MISRNSDVRCTTLDHSQYGREYASNCRDLVSILIPRGRQGVVVAEQLVCAVNQMDFQGGLQLNLIRATAFQSSGEIGWLKPFEAELCEEGLHP